MWFPVLLVAVWGVIVGTMIVSRRRLLRWRHRLVRRRPIAQLERGIITIEGEVLAADTVVEGPLRGDPCVLYKVLVEENGEDGWGTLFVEQRGVPFYVADDSGRTLVDPGESDVILRMKTRRSSNEFRRADARQKILLERHFLSEEWSAPGVFFDSTKIRDLRYRESRITKGDQIRVTGYADGPLEQRPGGYRALPSETRIFGTADRPLILTVVRGE